ncbi:FMN-binding protein [Candidatus Sulfurimonas marisnigri]|uniref:FMN-binding protein n=1 Tax=Candidatus Sulfurimonas marisnigri TaxID=2740405 RepID=A0A7S7RPL5_9BACT|nr:FMN-binding protein [Candidatus Sulfurimonas marisnigri]QOY53684.1 FMN-binding protein [Candidatus Sulfurimonas marisnigri]
MKKIIILAFLLLSIQLSAQMLISPYDAMKAAYGETSEISKKNIVLKNTQAKKISQDAKVKLYSKITRVFTAKKENELLGHGILISRTMRTKTVVVLYIITKDSVLKSSEIIAFNEPMEYLPSKTWLEQFENLSTDKRLRVSKDIPTITGATLTARGLVDGSRVAFAFYEEIIKGK